MTQNGKHGFWNTRVLNLSLYPAGKCHFGMGYKQCPLGDGVLEGLKKEFSSGIFDVRPLRD